MFLFNTCCAIAVMHHQDWKSPLTHEPRTLESLFLYAARAPRSVFGEQELVLIGLLFWACVVAKVLPSWIVLKEGKRLQSLDELLAGLAEEFLNLCTNTQLMLRHALHKYSPLQKAFGDTK